MRLSRLTVSLLASGAVILASSQSFAQEPGAAPASAPPSMPPSTTAAGAVTVHLNSPQPAALESRAAEGAEWVHACDAPCDTRLSVTDQYRVVGEGLRPSKPFFLDQNAGDKVNLDVAPGSQTKYRTGMYLVGGGAVAAVGGILMIALGAQPGSTTQETSPAGDGQTHNANTNWIFGGTALIVTGVVAAIGGGSLIEGNAHTRVGSPAAKPAPDDNNGAGAPVKGNGTVNLQVQASRQPVPTAPAMMVPLWRGTF